MKYIKTYEKIKYKNLDTTKIKKLVIYLNNHLTNHKFGVDNYSDFLEITIGIKYKNDIIKSWDALDFNTKNILKWAKTLSEWSKKKIGNELIELLTEYDENEELGLL